jgi:hypothetical protein
MSDIDVRTGQADFPLAKDDFIKRYRARFADPAFADKRNEIDLLLEVAWDGYRKARVRTQPCKRRFAMLRVHSALQ